MCIFFCVWHPGWAWPRLEHSVHVRALFLFRGSGFSRSVISLHALRFLGRLGSVGTFPPSLSLVILIVSVWLPGRAWSRPENSVHVRACLPLSQLGFFLSVIPLHALRFSGWLGTVEIPPHSFFFQICGVFCLQTHLFPPFTWYLAIPLTRPWI